MDEIIEKAFARAQRVKNQTYYAKNKERLLAQQHIYNAEHKEQLALYRKVRKAKRMECYWCNKKFTEPGYILRYHKHHFCDDKCLGEYLVERAEEEIEKEWFDTPENIKACWREEHG